MTTATADSPAEVMQRLYGFEQSMPSRVWLTQPMGKGEVKTYTFSEALNEARRIAAHLASRQLPPGSHIGILSKNTAHWFLTDLAIWMAGHVSIPLYPMLTAQSIAQIVEHSEAKLVFIGKLDGWEKMKPGIPASMPTIYMPLSAERGAAGTNWDEIVASTAPIAGSPTRKDSDIATIIYTSGTTGEAKGAMHRFSNMAAAAKGIGQVLSMQATDRVLSYLPLAHVVERWLIETCSYMFGYQVFFAESLDTFILDLQRARPTLFVSVPRLWLKFQAGVHSKMPAKKLARLLSIPILSGIVKKKVLTNLGLNHVRFAGTGSAPISQEIFDWYRKLGLELLEGYGMTENFAYSHCGRPGRVRPGYIGETYLHVEHRISPEGEVQVRSPGNMIGYYKNEAATRAMFTEDGYLKTGDRGEIDQQGRLRLTGRLKELFKTSKGKYVVPSPIESKLVGNGLLEQACVTGAGQPQPCAVVVLAEDTRKKLASGETNVPAIETALQRHVDDINSTLDEHEKLDFIAVARQPWLPENGFLTPTLKVKRQVVETTFAPMLDAWYGARKAVAWE